MTGAMLPAAKPNATREAVLARVLPVMRDVPLGEAISFLVFVRGYYDRTMGRPGNDRGIYDDAAFVIGPNLFFAFNANADPGTVRKGEGTGAGKGMARLKPGVWRAWKFGHHKAGTPGGHRALVQLADKVTVIRDGKTGDYEDTGFFGINVHKGGVTRTNSEGCLTIPPDQWPAFLRAVETVQQAEHGAKWDQRPVCVVLVEGW